MILFKRGATISDRIYSGLSNLLRLALLVAVFLEIYNGEWDLLFGTVMVYLMTLLPYAFEKRLEVRFPLEYEFLVVLFIFLSLFMGGIHDYYTYYWWWDSALHFGFGIAIGYAGFLILYTLYAEGKVKSKPFWIAAFTFLFAIGVGALWEILEFGIDNIFGANMQESGLPDTMGDLIVDGVGALLTSLAGYYYVAKQRAPIFSRLIKKFKEHNPHIFKKGKKISKSLKRFNKRRKKLFGKV